MSVRNAQPAQTRPTHPDSDDDEMLEAGPAGRTITQKSFKAEAPDKYDGNRKGLRVFLTQARLYLDFMKDVFRTEGEKVKAILALLKGPAFK